MDRGFLVSVGTPETAMSPDPKYAMLLRYSTIPQMALPNQSMELFAAEDLEVQYHSYSWPYRRKLL